MKTEVFFTRPGRDCEINDRIILDLKYATKRIIGSAYYLTEDNVKKAIKENKAPIKKFIFNHKLSDSNNNSNEIETFQNNINYVIIGKDGFPIITMHHKFIIIDDVLWVGSLNLSKNATINNWENMMRIVDPDILDTFYREFKRIYLWGKGNYEWDKYVEFNNDNMICKDLNCKKTIDDITNHHRLLIKVYDNYYYNLDTDAYNIFKNYNVTDISISPYYSGTHLTYQYFCIEAAPNINNLVCDCCKKVHRKEDLVIVENYQLTHYRKLTIINGVQHYENLYDSQNNVIQSNNFIQSRTYCYNCLYDYRDSIIPNIDFYEW